jgi:hypothetical protein
MHRGSRPPVIAPIRVLRKVRKTQHQNPEFGHTQDEILKKNLPKSTLAFNRGMKL